MTAIELLKEQKEFLIELGARYAQLCDDHSVKIITEKISSIDAYLSTPPSERAMEVAQSIDDFLNTTPKTHEESMQIVAREIEAFGAQGWVSVKERLPKVGQEVIAYRPTAASHHDDPITNCVYTGKPNTSWEGVTHGFDIINHPTHWMPLPSAPEAQGEEP